jgi:hypothetical protein
MSAISLYPMETIRVLNNVYTGQSAPVYTSAFDSCNNNITAKIVPSGPNETVILKTKTIKTNPIVEVIVPLPFANDGLNPEQVQNLFTTMRYLLVDISNNLGNPGLVSLSVDTLLQSLSVLKDSYTINY